MRHAGEQRLIGRDDELAELSWFVGNAARSGGALQLVGDPGVGKTALLDAAAALGQAAGLTILRELDGDSAHDALTRLRASAAARPLLVIIDDVAPPFADVMTFIGRRLSGSAVGLLFASRTGAGVLDERQIRPLDDESAVQLLRRHAPGLAPHVEHRILAEAAGNPLFLLELPRTRPPALTERLQDVFRPRLEALPAPTRETLVLVALEETGARTLLQAAEPALLDRLAPAEREDLLTVAGAVTFTHPLIRSAVVSLSTDQQRRAAHHALAAATTTDPDRRTWHRAEALDGPDPAVAAQLEEAAFRAARRGDPLRAVTQLRRAAELSPSPADATRRLFAAAGLSGDVTEIGNLLRDAPTTDHSLARATLQAYLLLVRDSDAPGAHRLLTEALTRGDQEPDDRVLAEALWTLSLIGVFFRDEPLVSLIAQYADRLPPLLRLRGGLDDALTIDAAVDALATEADPATVVRTAFLALAAGRGARCRVALRRVVEQVPRTGAVLHGLLSTYLLARISLDAGDWDIPFDTSRTLVTPLLDYVKGLLAASRGDDATALGESLSQGAGVIADYGQHVLGRSALARGDLAAAYRHLSLLEDPPAADLAEAAGQPPAAPAGPFDRARAQLQHGSQLRRERDAGAAAVLTDALATFQQLGATPWANRAARELRAIGRNVDTPTSASLTEQEHTIASLAASGLTNREIARQLHLSPSTVSHHLYRIFPKLGISTRAALRDALNRL